MFGSLGEGGGSRLVMMDDAKADDTEHDGMEWWCVTIGDDMYGEADDDGNRTDDDVDCGAAASTAAVWAAVAAAVTGGCAHGMAVVMVVCSACRGDGEEDVAFPAVEF